MTDSTDDVDWYGGDGEDGDLIEAVSWAYQKLCAFRVGSVSERDALMMDRLKVFVEYGE